MTQPTPTDPNALRVTPETRHASRAGQVQHAPVLGVDDREDDGPDFTTLTGAWWRRENTLGALLNYNATMPEPSAEEGFNPFAHFDANRVSYGDMEPYLLGGQFDGIYSQRDFEAKAKLLRQQETDQRTIQRGGTVGMLIGLGVGLLDPINLLPIWPLTAAGRAGNAVRVGASLAGAGAIQEGVLHTVDATRTGEESAFAIGGAAVLGAGVGSLVRRYDSPHSKWHPENPESPMRPEVAEAPAYHSGIPGRTADEGLAVVTNDSIGAARVNREHLKLATSDNEVAAAIQKGIGKVFDHASPLARVWHYASDKGRETMLSLMDTGGRLTKGMTEGKPVLSAEAIKATERQFLAGYQDRVMGHYRAANIAVGQSARETAVKSFGNSFRVSGNRGDFNRVAWADFQDAVAAVRFSKMLEGHGYSGASFAAKERVAIKFREKGFDPAQIEAVQAKVDAASKDVGEFLDRYKTRAIGEGLMDEKLDLGEFYGLPVLYQRGAINANPGTFKHILTRHLADNPPDEWLAEQAKRLGERDADGNPKGMTLDELKADKAALARLMLEWRGEYEQALAAGSAALLSDLTRRVEQALTEFEVIQHGVRVGEREKRVATVNAAKASARRAEADYFAARLGTAQRHAVKADERVQELVKSYPDLLDFADDVVRQFEMAGENLDAVIPGLREKRVVKTQADALVDALRKERSVTPPEQIAEAKLRLTEALAARKTANADLRAARAELDAAARESRHANRWLDAVTRRIDQSRKDLEARAEEPGLSAALARERARVDDLKAKAAEAEALRKEAVQTWREVRTGSKLSRAELRGLLRSQGRAKKLVKRVEKGTPMEAYIDDVIASLRGGERFPSGMLMDQVVESGRLKERRWKWSPQLWDELTRAGMVETDVMKMMTRYHDDLSGRIAVQKTLGTQNIEDVVKEIGDDYDSQIAKHQQAGNVKAADALLRMRQKNIDDVRVLFDKVTGKARPGGQGEESVVWWADTLRTLVYVGAAGGFVYSAVQDSATAMLVAAPFLPGLVRHAGSYRKLLKLAKAHDPEAKELKLILSSLEGSMHLPSEGSFLGEIAKHGELGFGDPKARAWSSKVEHALRVTSDRVNALSGLAKWSDLVRRTAALVQLSNLSEHAKHYDTLSPGKRANLASLGIGAPEAKRLGQLFAKHGRKVEGVFTPGTTKWLDEPDGQEMVDVLQRALTLTQRRASYVPGYGAVPNLMGKWYGAMLLQFQSYAFQFTHSFILAGTQRLLTTGDLTFLGAAATQLATTVLVSQVRAAMRGEDTEDWSQAKWASEIVNRSGALGFLAPYADAGIKLGGKPFNDLVGAEVFEASSKYRNNNVVGSLLGPTVGYGNSVFSAAGSALAGDLEGASDKAFRLMPLNQEMKMLGALSALGEWSPD